MSYGERGMLCKPHFSKGGGYPGTVFFGGRGLFYNASNMFMQVLVLKKSPLGFPNLLNKHVVQNQKRRHIDSHRLKQKLFIDLTYVYMYI